MLKLVKENPNHNVNFMVVEYGRLKEDFDFIARNITRSVTIDLATRHDHKPEDLERFAAQYFELLIEHEKDAELFQTLNPALHSNAYVREFGFKAQVREFHFCRTGLERLFIDTVRYRDWETDRKSTRLNSSHRSLSRMPSSA